MITSTYCTAKLIALPVKLDEAVWLCAVPVKDCAVTDGLPDIEWLCALPEKLLLEDAEYDGFVNP